MSRSCSVIRQAASFDPKILWAIVLLTVTTVYASRTCADVSRFEVVEDDGIYSINASVTINAPADYVRNVLTDFVHIYRLNPSIVESEVLESPENNATRVRTKVLGCVAAYCEEFERVEQVRVLASGDILAEVVPEASQFKTGVTLWKIESKDENTHLTYEARIEPDFFIPPLIGSVLVKARLREELTTSFARLEKIASIQAERDWDPQHGLPGLMVAGSTVPCE